MQETSSAPVRPAATGQVLAGKLDTLAEQLGRIERLLSSIRQEQDRQARILAPLVAQQVRVRERGA